MSKQKDFHKFLNEKYRHGPFVHGLFRDFVNEEYKPFSRKKHINGLKNWWYRVWFYDEHPSFSRCKNKSWKERRRTQYHPDKHNIQEFTLKFENSEQVEEKAPDQFAANKEWKETHETNWLNRRCKNLFPGTSVRWIGSYIEPENPSVEVYLVRICGDEKTDVIHDVIKHCFREDMPRLSFYFGFPGLTRKLISVEKNQ